MRMKLAGLFAADLLVAACESTPDQTASTSGGGTSAPPPAVASTPQPQAPTGNAPGSAAEFRETVGDRMFFEFDSAVIKPEGKATLQRQAAWLRRWSGTVVTVEGHCDERGTREYNLALGERRAAAAKNYLVLLGIDPSRVKTISYGKERPEALGANEAAWSQNRRAVTRVHGARGYQPSV